MNVSGIFRFLLGLFYAGLSILVIILFTRWVLGLIARHTPAPVSSIANTVSQAAA